MQSATHPICCRGLTALVGLTVVALVSLLTLLSTRPASADAQSSYEVTAPKGWQEYPAGAESQAEMVRRSDPFGGLRFGVKVTAHAMPQQGAFYVTWLAAEEPSKDLGKSVRTTLDELRSARIATSPQAGSTEELSHSEQEADNVTSMELSWRHVSNEIVSHSRTFIWASSDNKLRMVRAECVLSADGPQEAACKKALSTLRPIPKTTVALGAVPTATAVDEGASRENDLQVGNLGTDDSEGQPEDSEDSKQQSMGAELKVPNDTHAVLPQEIGVEDTEPSITNKALIIVGAILLVVAFWFTTRRREDEPPADEDDEDDEDEKDPAPEDEGDEEE